MSATTTAWLVLAAAGVLEAVWAAALAAADNLRRLRPTVLFAVALAGSMAGLAFAMTVIPTGTAYAVWVGIGASLAVGWAMVTGAEPATRTRVLLLAGLVACVVGLKVVS
ncbi:MAG TPA: ligand-binding protein SH3 [Micrococcales bacterium]|uniref:DMT family transporter n=1 Tax=Miniimonas arenae TaxID=676201 RepID=UPI000ED45EE4|nr:SMR family transporter [Miniimonas arenae]HCX85619.1 ligand-binding protein SH3 [Micrococcales bacterium]